MQNKYLIFLQTILLLLVLIWPFKIELSLPAVVKNAGIFFLVGGFVLEVLAIRTLKDNLRPFPKPKTGGTLITTGVYSIVRHPAYGAILIATLGLSLWADDGARLVLFVCLFLFFDGKSKMEEELLEKAYPEYSSYKKQVAKKFIPGIY